MTERGAHSDSLLVKELIAGNEKAFRVLFDTYRNDLYKYSLSMVIREAYAEEIVQDVFMKVWIKRESLNPNLSFRSYIFTITRNMNIKFLKKASNNLKLREELFYRSQKSSNPTELMLAEAEMEKLKQQALDQLPPKRRQIFELSRNEGLSYEAISEELGISPHTVRNHMSKALETLRKILSEHIDLSLALLLLSLEWI